ncbi:MAG: hypothetical protein KDI09_14900, partial [Halioglobus sp.]|nr:hypothetical protein [Halioglobus sp.]
YLSVGRLMRGERCVEGVGTLRARIAATLEAEPDSADNADSYQSKRWARPAAGVAIAASVAMLALLGLRQVEFGDNQQSPSSAVAGLAAAPQASYTEPALSETVLDRPSDMLMQYYLSHGATSGDLGANGILSRLVTLELRGEDLVDVAPLADEPELAPVAIDQAGEPPARIE